MQPRLALAGLALAMLLASLGTSIATVALPTLAQHFSASVQAIQWVVLAYLIAVTALIVGAGRLGDIAGRRRLLLAGILLFTAASLACAAAPTSVLWPLIAARAAQGFGAALMIALAMALAGDTVAPDKTGRAMGLLGTMSAVGTALGPSLGGALIAGFGWRAIFLINLPLGMLTFWLAWRYLPGAPRAARAAPVLMRLALLRDRALQSGLAVTALAATVVMTTLVVGPFYLTLTLKLDAAVVGLVMSAGPLVAALGGVPAGRVVDRFGAPRMTMTGVTVMAAGCALMGLLPADLGVAGYGAALVIITTGYALLQAANNTAVMTRVDAGERGVAAGLINLARNLGLIAGASLMGAVFALAGLRVTFALAAALMLGALTLWSGAKGITPPAASPAGRPRPDRAPARAA